MREPKRPDWPPRPAPPTPPEIAGADEIRVTATGNPHRLGVIFQDVGSALLPQGWHEKKRSLDPPHDNQMTLKVDFMRYIQPPKQPAQEQCDQEGGR